MCTPAYVLDRKVDNGWIFLNKEVVLCKSLEEEMLFKNIEGNMDTNFLTKFDTLRYKAL